MKRFALLGMIALALLVATAHAQDKATKSKPKSSTPAKSTAATQGTAKGKAKPAQQMVRPDAIPGYKIQVIEGFNVVLSDETVKNQDNKSYERKPLEVLELELKTITKLLPPEAVNVLRGLLIWVEWSEREAMSNGRQGSAAAVYYGGHQLQMLEEGKHPLKAKNITILRMDSLTQEHQPKHDSGRCVILHEMTHAVHDQFLGDDNLMIKAGYKQALERKLYDPQMYAATNEHEYFAELTCAYFDQLNYYPRTRKDLEKHDPVTYQMMESIWGRRSTSTDKADQVTSADLKLKLEDLKLGKPVMGPTITAKELQGQVVVVVFWHAASTSSLACFQKLNAWNAELSDFGLASVAIHLTGTDEQDVRKAAESRNVSFTVTEGRWTNDGLINDFKDFPRCLVFDASGKCVFRGAPFDAEPALRSSVGKALVDSCGVTAFPKAMTAQVEALRGGTKPPAMVLPQLIAHTRSSDDETSDAAKKLVAKMTEGGQRVLEAAEPLLKQDPVGAYLKIERLPVVFKGTPVATSATKMLGKLRREKAVVTELRARPALVMVRSFDTELGSRPGSFDPKQKEFRHENAELLQQLRETVILMKKSWPTSCATAEALHTSEHYGLILP